MTGDDFGNPWRTMSVRVVFDGPYFAVRSDVVRHGQRPERPYTSIRAKYAGVAVIPIDDEGCTTLVGQYRYVHDGFTWEIPAGAASLSDPVEESAKRELREETGFTADRWLQVLATAVSPGNSDEWLHGFVAWGLRQGDPQPDDEELIVPRRVPFSEAVTMALSGDIKHVGGVAVLLAIETRRRRGELPDDLLRLL